MIVAASENDVIGRNNDLPWHVPEDLRRFRQVTMGRCLIVGRLTHESIVGRLGRPLPGRHTFVVSRRLPARGERDGVQWAPNVADAANWARETAEAFGHPEVFVIGGVSIYAQLLPQIERIQLTRVCLAVPDGDALLPPGWLDAFARVELANTTAPNGTPVRFETYVRAAR